MDVAQLASRDYILLLDKSMSMNEKDGGSTTRWSRAKELTVGFAQKCMEFDSDGITVIPFAGKHTVYNNVDGGDEVIKKIFEENEPGGSTDTAGVLKYVLDDYFARNSKGGAKPITILCVTDGEPTDPIAVEKVIIDATKKMTADEQIGISFIQIGNDQRATAYLKNLDDGLQAKGAKWDIVDTKTSAEIENMKLVDVLIQAITD